MKYRCNSNGTMQFDVRPRCYSGGYHYIFNSARIGYSGHYVSGRSASGYGCLFVSGYTYKPQPNLWSF